MSEDVSVIGIGGRFPGADDCEQFWENLRALTSSIREVPGERWEVDCYYSPIKRDINKTVSKWGGFIDDVDKFDSIFFGISPKEAKFMDPQQRILLELAWSCLEDAGYTRETLSGSRTGAFIGVMNFDYRERLSKEAEAIEGHMSTGTYTSLIPNRISHFFDWHGPSIPIDTACSSSLVALHEAVHSLRRGECDQALAGGVSVLCSPTYYISFSKTGMLSPEGLCRTFDDSAKGYVRGEGAALVMLKRLQDAIEDGDRIYGVICGSAVNHGGQARTVTYPNPQAQADVIATAYEHAGIRPDSVSYIEAHGTGTPKGDPIEINGLKAAFARLAKHFDCDVKPHSCGLGSLKANVGHLEPVAGIAGVIKVLLAMKHRTLPGLAHFQRLNHRIDLTDSPFFIVDKTQGWPARQDAAGQVLPRRAGVSSFGFGGVNAHAIVEEWTDGVETVETECAPPELTALIVLSAKNDDRLHASAMRLLDWLRRPHSQPLCLADIAYTLQVGRSAMEERLGIVVRSLDDLVCKLEAFVSCAAETGDFYRGSVFPEDQDTASATLPVPVAELIADGRDSEVVQLWVKGGVVDWNSLYAERQPKRIGLPGYPFARESYWLLGNGQQKTNGHPSKAQQCETTQAVPLREGVRGADARENAIQENGGGSAVSGPVVAPDVMYFEERWIEQPLDTAANRPIETLICFASREETRQAITEFVQTKAPRIRLVFVADAALEGAQASVSGETVVSGDPQSFQQLFERLKAAYGKADAVLYLWPLEDQHYISDFSPAACIIQAIGKSHMTIGALILAAQGDDGKDRCYWEALAGLERSASMVLPETAVAVTYEAAGRSVQRDDLKWWTEITWAELKAEKIQSSLYRDNKRYVCRVEPATIYTSPPVLRKGGTYLITGGMGGLGYLFAEHLAQNYAARIVLTGRTPLDEAKRKKLDALAAAGDVLYWQADVCDEAGMRACLETLKARFGKLHGVIHAAGVESWQNLLASDLTEFLRVLKPKIQGTLALDEVLCGEPIDFLCYFSSSSAIIGDLGACCYAIGNRFQMAHARWRQERRCAGKTLAINWPLWNDGGMRIGDAQSTEFYLKSTGQRLLENDEGKQVFETLLGQQDQQYLVMCGEPAKIQRMLKLGNDGGVALSSTPIEVPHSEELSEIPLLARVEDDLLNMASHLLHVERERLALDRNLAGFGFDSINMAAFSASLSRRYGIEVMPSIFFSFPTLGRLAKHFVEQHREAVEACYREAATVAPVNIEHSGEEAAPEFHHHAKPVERTSAADSIVVIGMSGRFPGARNIKEMWSILAEGRNAVSRAPADRDGGWADSDYRCGFVSGVSEFDPLFFEISPREADSMDPRQRLLLEETWKALEDAGYGAAQLSSGRTGIFTGVEDGDYQRLEDPEGSITSNHNGILAGRLAYHLDLTGPVLSINTACSSGLVALHQACQSLRNDECDTAIVAAANLFLTPYVCRQMGEAGMLSSDGTCYAFDKRANGMVPGEAVAVLVLKRLSQAKASNDRIHAVIAGSGVNSDGRTNGITAPNGISQTRLIESVYRKAAIDPEQIDYVVAHGTGTKLGDPVEVNAIVEAFRSFTKRSGYCALTSPKTNLGHTLAASGLVSVISLIEAMRHETIPASLHWEMPNPFIQLQASPFFVNLANRHWPQKSGRVRMGAVSSFGMSGTNAHVVVQEYAESAPERTSVQVSLPCHLFVLSAKTEKALKRKIADMIAVFEASEEDSTALANISYTLLERRHHFKHRLAFVADSAGEAVRILREANGQALPNSFSGKVPADFRPQPVLQQKAETLAAQYPAANGQSVQFRESLRELASLYCQGYFFSIAALTEPVLPKVVSLPEYPFSRERHWIHPVSCDGSASAVREHAAVSKEPSSTPIKAMNGQSGAGTLLLSPVWEPVNGNWHGTPTIPGGRFVVAGEGIPTLVGIDNCEVLRLQTSELAATETIIRKISAHGEIDHVIWYARHQPQSAQIGGDRVIQRQEASVLACFRLIKALLELGYGGRELNWYVITERSQAINAGEVIDAVHSGLHGLIGSLAKEQPNWKIRLADVPSIDAVPLNDLLALPPDRRGHAQVYRYGEWYRRHLVPVHPAGEHCAPYRQGGVYIVIGGAGDIGAAWSEHMIARQTAKIIWVGRREKDAQIEARLARLARIGTAPQYFQADAGKLDELQALRSAVLGRYGVIHGIIHAAMVFGNHDLADMTESQFKAALYAKVNVSVRLAQVFGRDPLDFLLFFSSMISLIKNPKQAHYAAGCTFNDAFAHQLAQDMSCPVKVVNWGYWAAEKNASMPEVRQLNELGVGLIEPGDGMRALDVLLGSPLPQLGVMQLTKPFEVEGMSTQETIDLYPAPKAPDWPDAPSPYGLLGGL